MSDRETAVSAWWLLSTRFTGARLQTIKHLLVAKMALTARDGWVIGFHIEDTYMYRGENVFSS